jgi:hypothetical protein
MTAATVTPVQDDVMTALGNFIVTVTGLPTSCVVRGIDNQVPMPVSGFISMTGLYQIPQSTNVDAWDTTSSDPTELTASRTTRFDVQVDCYGAQSPAWASMLTTLFRDDYGCQQLAPNCQPLYCEDARMLPLTDAEEQYEERWSFTAAIGYTPVVTVPQMFANSLKPAIINVPATYPIN